MTRYDDTIDIDEDREVPFSEESNDTNNQKPLFDFNEREKYDSDLNHAINHVTRNGKIPYAIGIVTGLAIDMIAVVSHAFRVVINNVIFGGHEHFDFARAKMEATGYKRLNNATVQQKENKEKEETQKKQSTKDKANPEEKHKYEEEKNNDNSETKVPKEKDIFKQVQIYIQQMTSEEVNEIVDVLLNSDDVCNIFKEVGLHCINEHDSSNIFLFSDRQKMNVDKIPCIDKRSFLLGNTKDLAAALSIYKTEMRLTSTHPEKAALWQPSVIDPDIKAVAMQTKILELLNRGIYEKSDLKEQVKIVGTDILTEENRHYKLDFIYGEKPRTTKLFISGNEYGTIDLTKSSEEIKKIVSESLSKQIDKDKTLTKQLGNIHYQKISETSVNVTIQGKTKEFTLNEEKDMIKLKEFLNESGINPKEAEIKAMLITLETNPILQKTQDEYGFEIHPFSNRHMESGDLYINTGEMPPKIQMYEVKAIGGYARECHTDIISVHEYTDRADYSECIIDNAIEILNREKKISTLDDMIQPKEKNSYKRYEPNLQDGKIAQEHLKQSCILKGEDNSKFVFIEKQTNEQTQENPKVHEENSQLNTNENKETAFTEDVLKNQDETMFWGFSLSEEEIAAYQQSCKSEELSNNSKEVEIPDKEADELEL